LKKAIKSISNRSSIRSFLIRLNYFKPDLRMSLRKI
jgi:hypothetical protein